MNSVCIAWYCQQCFFRVEWDGMDLCRVSPSSELIQFLSRGDLKNADYSSLHIKRSFYHVDAKESLKTLSLAVASRVPSWLKFMHPRFDLCAWMIVIAWKVIVSKRTKSPDDWLDVAFGYARYPFSTDDDRLISPILFIKTMHCRNKLSWPFGFGSVSIVWISFMLLMS